MLQPTCAATGDTKASLSKTSSAKCAYDFSPGHRQVLEGVNSGSLEIARELLQQELDTVKQGMVLTALHSLHSHLTDCCALKEAARVEVASEDREDDNEQDVIADVHLGVDLDELLTKCREVRVDRGLGSARGGGV